MKFVRDISCPKCLYPETITEVLHNNMGGERRQSYCNHCGWSSAKTYRYAKDKTYNKKGQSKE
jgi:hypothetical protein